LADPASIAFAQLAEEYRRAGNFHEAVRYCRNGLARHPGYLSARVTLGRALTELDVLDEASHEFELVLKSAPDNLAAIRGLAEIHQRRGELQRALDFYKRALALARFDPDLEETVSRIGREMGTVTAPATHEGLSFEQATSELLSAATRVPAALPPARTLAADPAANATPEANAPAAPTEPTGASAPDEPSAPEAPSSPRPDLIDFDAILASLGVPDAAPPPLMQMLLSKSPPAPPRTEPDGADEQREAAIKESFAELEREFRSFESASAEQTEESAVAAVVEELESWLRVLDRERAPQRA
jgi:tetratricopeptide (TPR) repeat protein